MADHGLRRMHLKRGGKCKNSAISKGLCQPWRLVEDGCGPYHLPVRRNDVIPLKYRW